MNTRRTDPPGSAADRLANRLVDGIPVTARRLETGGVSTALLEGGAGSPVVLLHGQGGFAESLAGVISALQDRYYVVAPDLPGLGRSELGGGALATDRLVDWLGRLIAATCVTPPIIVGFAAGAGIAVRGALAATPPVRRLVFVSPTSFGPLRLSVPLRIALSRFRRKPSRTTADRVARHLFHDPDLVRGSLGSRFTAVEDYVIDRAQQPGARVANRALSAPIGADELRGITVPVAVIGGRHDQLVPIDRLQRVGAERGWPLTLIDGAGHLPHVEQPKAFNGALRAAIDPTNQPPHQQENQ